MVTEDGVKIYNGETLIDSVDDQYELHCISTLYTKVNGWKVFGALSTAREYILMNKPVFSIKDIQSNKSIHLSDTGLQALEHIAKERINQNK